MSAEPDIQIDQPFLSGHLELFSDLVENVFWDDSMAARRTASFGRAYNYSQITYDGTAMLPALVPVADQFEARLGIRFNNCLLNYYQTGDNSMGFHFG